MADISPAIAPTLSQTSSLAPPSNPARPNSANSNGSSQSRRGRSPNSSSNVSRSNSHSSRGGSDADKTKTSGSTTTISGGISLGTKGEAKRGRKKGSGVAGGPGVDGSTAVAASGQKTIDAKTAGDKPEKPKTNRRTSGKSDPARRPTPINTAPVRTASQNSNPKVTTINGDTTSQSAPTPRSLHAPVSAPRTAMEAAVDAAQKKHNAISGGDVLASLQKMISDLKTLPAPPAPASGSSQPQPASRSASGAGARDSPATLAPPRSTDKTSPITIPGATTGSKKLKADAPSFTPSFPPTSISPVASQPSISPGATMPPPWAGKQPRSASQISMSNRRASSSNGPGTLPAFNAVPNINASSAASNAGVSQYPMYQHQLHFHPEAENEDHSLMSFSQDADSQYHQQQLLAAQQMQYQQIQLLQAQLAASKMAQQHSQQQMQGSGFVAPRFQALAAQRVAQQQQQQAAQLAQAQQMFELQQQQLLEYTRQQDEEARARATVEATLKNPPPVFEEDSPEQRPASLGPTGRPQLAPKFTFGTKKDDEPAAERTSLSPPQLAPVINRSEGIGGAAATGLAGLAARAHKRTGSEISTAMQQQLELQEQIEALQAKQKALMHEDLSTQGESPLSQLSTVFGHKSTPSQTIARHRRAQSGMPSANLAETFGSMDLSNPSQKTVRSGVGEMPPPPLPSGHLRRHSVNVFNKPAGSGAGFSISSEIPEEPIPNGYISFSGHQRSGSRSGFESGNWRATAQAGGGGGVGPVAVADLAAAQAQLQSLAQFRAAAGGGHSKMASFSFPNMLPNLLAATTLSTPAGSSLWQQQQAFQTQLQQSSNGPQRKSLFAPYLPQASLPPLLSAGKLVVGILRVNKKNRSDAYVATDVLEADIYICGSKDRNRALEGDIVAVELLDVDEVWSTKKDKEEKKKRKEENAAYDLKPAQAKKLEKKKDDVEVEGQGLTLFEDEEVNDETKPTYAGHVVAVVERMPGQLFSGQLGVLRPSSAATKEKQELERRQREGDRGRKDDSPAHHDRPKIVWFKPTDKRVPLIAIPTEQAPSDFIDNPDGYAARLFVATIKRWPITSLHPFGTLVEELGLIGDREVETSALLKDCNFPTEEFTDLTMKCLPPLPWTIPEREYEIRKDFREDRVFTIDPPTAKDLDDALSIQRHEDGTFKVGIHIADVSYFVKANTAIDREARKRATSVYLVQRAVPMLPPQLSEELCSLQPGKERLALSAMFKFDTDGNVLEKDFARSIVKSCARLGYDDAATVVQGGFIEHDKVAEHPVAEVEADIKALYDISTKLRRRRLDGGAMANTKLKVKVMLDDSGQPIDCDMAKRNDGNVLVEEFMLLANMAVGRMIAHGLPEQAILRRHEPPIGRRIDSFVNRARKLGYEFDGTTALTLQKGFDGIKDAEAALCLELLKRKAMQRARYFCTGMLDIAKYSHWALNEPLYTHFTSPIRRYADVLVHRMLDSCLSSPNSMDVKFHMDRDQVAKCAQQCNMKKQSAKLAEDQSTHLYLCMLIHDLTERYGPVVRDAKVTSVLDEAFDVVIPDFGIEKRVHVDKMPVENATYDEHKDILSLYWTKQDVLSYLSSQSDDPHLLNIKSFGERHALGSSTAQSRDADALLHDEAPTTSSRQYRKSAHRPAPRYEGLRSTGGHMIQDVRELMSLSVIVTSDMTKSPPVIVVYACNPYAS